MTLAKPASFPLALAISVLIVCAGDIWPEPSDLATVVVVGGTIAGLVALGAIRGVWALLIFAAVLAGVSIVYELTLWPDDPELSGIDDFSPTQGYMFVLPFCLVPVTVGVVARSVIARRQRKGAARGPLSQH